MNECSIAGGEALAELVRTAHGIDAVPFNEACMWREINDEPLFSPAFCAQRAQAAFDDARLNRGIALYFAYRDPNGRLAALAKQNGALGREFRVNLLLSLSAAYGITDRMAEELIG